MKLETDAKIKTQQWDGKGSLVTFVLKKNLHRRDISSSQRAVVALNAEKEYAEEAKDRQQQSPGRPKKGTQFSEEVFEDSEKSDHSAAPTTHTTSSKSSSSFFTTALSWLEGSIRPYHLTSSQRAALSGDVIKELELEAKERKQLLSGTRSNPTPKEQVPQKSGEPAHNDEPEPFYPERRRVDTAPAPAKATVPQISEERTYHDPIQNCNATFLKNLRKVGTSTTSRRKNGDSRVLLNQER